MNYLPKIEEMKKLFLNWSKRILTHIGKITVIKSLALSKINHLILSLPKPSEKITQDIQTLFNNYLWNGGPDKIKRSVVIQNYDRGLRMIDVDSFINSLKLTWLWRMLITPNKYFTTISRLYPILYDCNKFGSQYLTERKLRNINIFWRDILSTYKSFIDMVKPKNMNEIMSTPLRCNKNIKVGGNTVLYKTWSDNGIMCLSDIFSMDGQILSYEEFRLKYNFQINFLEFYGLIK